MSRNANLFLSLLLPFILSVAGYGRLCAQQKFIFTQPAMGSPFIISIYGNDSAGVANAAAKAFRLIDTLNAIFSDYTDSSELSRLSATSGSGRYIPVSVPMLDILQRAVVASQMSNGRFDITIGPVVRLWRRARKERSFPDEDSIKAALQRVGYHYIHIDTAKQAVWLEKPGMKLDLGGIAKGYAAQAALQVIQHEGYAAAMVDAGGDMAIGSPPPGREGWRIAVNLPEASDALLSRLLLLKNCAVATSGDVYQFLEWKGKRYSHTIDPRTGTGSTNQRNVTVIAGDGSTADWMASACSLLPLRRSFSLVRKFPGTALLITAWHKGKIRYRYTASLRNYITQ